MTSAPLGLVSHAVRTSVGVVVSLGAHFDAVLPTFRGGKLLPVRSSTYLSQICQASSEAYSSVWCLWTALFGLPYSFCLNPRSVEVFVWVPTSSHLYRADGAQVPGRGLRLSKVPARARVWLRVIPTLTRTQEASRRLRLYLNATELAAGLVFRLAIQPGSPANVAGSTGVGIDALNILSVIQHATRTPQRVYPPRCRTEPCDLLQGILFWGWASGNQGMKRLDVHAERVMWTNLVD